MADELDKLPENLIRLLDRVEERLQARGYSPRKASLLATQKPDLIRDIKRGSMPSADKLAALATVLDTSPEYLLGKDDVSTPASEARKEIPSLIEMPKDIPVYGTAIGADIEFMSLVRYYVANAPRRLPMSRDRVTGVIVCDTVARFGGVGHVFRVLVGGGETRLFTDHACN